MSAATITNFITPTKNVLSWAKTRLATYSTWNVYQLDKNDKQSLFIYLTELKLPSAVLVYTGSQYPIAEQRRVGQFSVIVCFQAFTDQNDGGVSAQDLLDKSISLLDHELYEENLCTVSYDKLIDFPNTGIAAYEVGFIFKDH
jgi:hypothetical protein